MCENPNSCTKGKYTIENGLNNEFNICYNEIRPNTNSKWQISNSLVNHMPIFMLQLSVVLLLTNIFLIILKPIRQPSIVAQLLAGIMVGPSVLGLSPWILNNFSPFETTVLLEVVGNLGLTLYMFLVGLEMDLTPIKTMGKAAASVAIAGIAIPGCVGGGLYLLLGEKHNKDVRPFEGGIFWGIALTVTSFPDLARILSSLKLLYTDLGKTALTSAVFTDLVSWILLVSMTCMLNARISLLYAISPTLLFIIIFWFLVRPCILKLIERIAERNESSVEGKYSQKHVGFIVTGALFFGLITELCGVHSMFGGFMFGLMIPGGELGTKIMDTIEEFVVGIMLPPVFFLTGLRTNLPHAFTNISLWLVIGIIFVAISVKIISTLIVCMFFKCAFRDSLALGVLMNTKGVLAIIVINEGRNLMGFNQQTFTWMIISILFMTGMVGPVLSFTHKSIRYSKHSYRRNLERNKLDEELRLLACVHSSKNVASIINLLRLSKPSSRKSLITVFAVHLVELTGRASAMMIFHDKRNTNIIDGNETNQTREKVEAEQIINAFQSFQNENYATIVHPLTAVSAYASMHEDVCNFAVEKRVLVILLPFYKKAVALGEWMEESPQYKLVTENLLENAPCSVGIIVDRGITPPFPLDHTRKFRITVIFIQGPDYREALAYAWRMAGNPEVTLTVLRFISGKESEELEVISNVRDDEDDSELFSATFESEKQKLLDDDYINEFRFKTMHNKSITYCEKQVNSGDQILSTIQLDYEDNDLYIVGRGHGMQTPLTNGLSEWAECEELGVIGDTLVSTDRLQSASVLVMQQSASINGVSKKTNKYAPRKGTFGNSGQTLSGPYVNHRTLDDY